MAGSGSSQKVANSLVAMSSAAVLAVYAAGYVRTRPAADRLAKQAVERSLAREARPAEQVVERVDAPKPQPAKATPRPEAKPVLAAIPKVETAQVPRQEAAMPVVETPALVVTPPSAPAVSVAPGVEQPAVVPATPAAPIQKVWRDGKYVGWGGSRHGDIQATVVIEGGRIVSAQITECQTRYPCDVIEKLPGQVVSRQSPNVQRISGATESADAFYSAVYFALQQAR